MSNVTILNNNRSSLFMDVVSRIHDVAKYYEGQGNEWSQLLFGGKDVHPNVAVWNIDEKALSEPVCLGNVVGKALRTSKNATGSGLSFSEKLAQE